MTPTVTDGLGRLLYTTAWRDGVGPALEALHRAAGPDTLCCGPGGHVIASAETVRSARRVRLPGGSYDRSDLAQTDLTTPALARAGLVGLRFVPAGPGERRAQPVGTAWALQPVWLRLGVSVRLREFCLTHLEQRRVGDAPLLQQQMIKGQLADVAIGQLEAETTLVALDAGVPDLATALDVDRRISGVDHELLTLLGASGYLSDGPGQALYVSEMITDLYLPRPGSDRPDA